VVFGQIGHQVEEIVQFVGLMVLEQRQYQRIPIGGDEVVGVLDAGADALEVLQGADLEALQELLQFVFVDGREYGHAGSRIARVTSGRWSRTGS
jgi:hypothetical protein